MFTDEQTFIWLYFLKVSILLQHSSLFKTNRKKTYQNLHDSRKIHFLCATSIFHQEMLLSQKTRQKNAVQQFLSCVLNNRKEKEKKLGAGNCRYDFLAGCRDHGKKKYTVEPTQTVNTLNHNNSRKQIFRATVNRFSRVKGEK